MKSEGPRYERETVINWNEEDQAASIWTSSATIARRLAKRLGPGYLVEDDERHVIYQFPKRWLILPRARVASGANKAAKRPQEHVSGGKKGIPEGKEEKE